MSGDYAAIVKSDACHQMVAGYVDELNKNLNRWETIKKWELLDHDLTVESGELTPSMKVKRNVVEDNYKDAHRRLLRVVPTEPHTSCFTRFPQAGHQGQHE